MYMYVYIYIYILRTRKIASRFRPMSDGLLQLAGSNRAGPRDSEELSMRNFCDVQPGQNRIWKIVRSRTATDLPLKPLPLKTI